MISIPYDRILAWIFWMLRLISNPFSSILMPCSCSCKMHLNVLQLRFRKYIELQTQPPIRTLVEHWYLFIRVITGSLGSSVFSLLVSSPPYYTIWIYILQAGLNVSIKIECYHGWQRQWHWNLSSPCSFSLQLQMAGTPGVAPFHWNGNSESCPPPLKLLKQTIIPFL